MHTRIGLLRRVRTLSTTRRLLRHERLFGRLRNGHGVVLGDGSGSSVRVSLPVAVRTLHMRRVLLVCAVSLVLGECYGEIAVAHEVVFTLKVVLRELATLIHTRCSTAAGYLVSLSFPLVLYGCHCGGGS